MSDRPDRALSPVIGTVLLVAIVALLAGFTAAVLTGATERKPPAPTVEADLDPTEAPGEFELRHVAGETLDGDRLVVRGIENPDVLAGERLVAGETVTVTPVEETVTLVWFEDVADPVSYTLQTFDINPEDVGTRFDGTIFTGSPSGIKSVEGDGGSVTTIPGTSGVEALGPASTDLTGDGAVDVPYVDSSGRIHAVGPDGSGEVLATSSDIPGTIASSKTRLGAGTWRGSAQSVFFVDKNHDQIYRVAPGGSPTLVAAPGDGAQAIAGPGDIDGDGDEELVFADASQTLQYVEPSGTVVDTGLSLGSNVGIGAGSLADFDGDGAVEVAAVDGGNYIHVATDTGGGKVTSTDVAGSSAPQAKKSTATAADVDGDADQELVYVGLSSGRVKYLDEIGSGTARIEVLHDDTGAAVSGSATTGVT